VISQEAISPGTSRGRRLGHKYRMDRGSSKAKMEEGDFSRATFKFPGVWQFTSGLAEEDCPKARESQ